MSSTNQNNSSFIALLTDFGTTDPYVGSLKAAIYNITPNLPIIDICHDITPQNILQAAFVLRMVYRDYPDGTIFVGIIDPGVGSARLPIAFAAGPYYFIGPDNGLFSYIYQQESVTQIVKITNDKLWRQPVSSTFHGRDIFAPCAAWLGQSHDLSSLGPVLEQKPKTLTLPIPHRTELSSLEGEVLHIDRFGNLITNIHHKDLERECAKNPVEITIADWTIPLGDHYSGTTPRSLLAIWGSSGFLEIAARNGSAREVLDCELQEKVNVNCL